MAGEQLTHLYIETSWTQFATPYYDEKGDFIYYTAHTDVTKLEKTWELVFDAHRSEAFDFFKSRGYFSSDVLSDQEISAATVLPIISHPAFACPDPALSAESVSLQTLPKKGSLIFENNRKTIDPRPGGTISLLYIIKDASTKNINLQKIQDDFSKWLGSKPKPPIAHQTKDFSVNLGLKGLVGKCVGAKKQPDGSITEGTCAGDSTPCKSNSDCAAKLKDFAKIKNIGNVSDLNDFLAAMVKESEQLRMAALSSNAMGGDPGEMNLAGSVRADAKVLGTTTVQENVLNESLRSSEYLTDYALLDIPYMMGDIAEGTDAFGGSETAKSLLRAKKEYTETMNWLFAQANKWGLMGLVECSMAHLIQVAEAQGAVDLAQLMTEELKKSVGIYKSLGAEFKQYKEIVRLAKLRYKSGQGWKNDFGAQIEKQVKEALIEIVKQLINLLTQYCLEQLTAATPDADYGWGSLAPEQVFNDPDIPSGALAAFNPAATPTDPDALAKLKKELDGLIKEIFGQLTPKEICALMQGTSAALIPMLYKKVQKYPKLSPIFSNEQSVADYFYKMGKLSGTAFCKDMGTKKYDVVEYCGLKLKKPLADVYEDKLGDQLPDFPSISLDDLKNLIDDDMVEDAIPPFDYKLILEPSYKVAQQDLFIYEKTFNRDITSAFSPESQAALDTTSNKAGLDASSKGLDLNAEDKKNLDKAKSGDKKLNISKALGKGASALKDPITVDKLPLFDPKIVKSPTSVSIKNGWWSIEGLLKGSVLGSGGHLDVEGYEATFTNDQPLLLGLPTTGIEVTSNNNVSPLSIIGENIPETPYETSQKGLTKPSETRQLTKNLTVADLYTDILFKILSGYIDSLSATTAKVDYASKLDIERIKRRARVLSTLCTAENAAAKGNETPAQAYITNDSTAMDVESLRIFAYLLLVENYPNLIVSLMSLPSSAIDKFGNVDNAKLIWEVVNKFDALVKNSLVAIPVKNIMCAANLTVVDLIEEEIKFLKNLSSSGTGSPSIEATLKDTLAFDYTNAGYISFTATEALKTYFSNWLGYPSETNLLKVASNVFNEWERVSSYIMDYREAADALHENQYGKKTPTYNTKIPKSGIGKAPWHYNKYPKGEAEWEDFPYDTIEDIIDRVFVEVYGKNTVFTGQQGSDGKKGYFGQNKGLDNYKHEIWKDVRGFYEWVSNETFTTMAWQGGKPYNFEGKDFAQTLMMVLAVFRVLWHMNYNAHMWLKTTSYKPREIHKKKADSGYFSNFHHQTYEDAVKGIFFGGDNVYQPNKKNPTPWGVNVSDVALEYTTQYIAKNTPVRLKEIDDYVAPLDFNKDGVGSIMWWVINFGTRNFPGKDPNKLIPEPDSSGKGKTPGLVWSAGNTIFPKLGVNAKQFLETSSKWGKGKDWADIVGKVITDAAPTKLNNPILSAFNPSFIATLLAYFTRAYALTPKKNQEIFFELKPAIMNRFTAGASGIPVGIDIEKATNAAAALDAARKLKFGELGDMGMAMWLLILLFVPKLVHGIVKGVVMSALFFSNPVVYAILMMAESLGLSIPEFFDWLDEKTRREILATLDPDSPEAKSLQKELDTGSKTTKPPILAYECKILP